MTSWVEARDGPVVETIEYFSESLSKLLMIPLASDSKIQIMNPMFDSELAYLISQPMLSCLLMYGSQSRRFFGCLE